MIEFDIPDGRFPQGVYTPSLYSTPSSPSIHRGFFSCILASFPSTPPGDMALYGAKSDDKQTKLP